MKKILIILIALALFGCKENSDDTASTAPTAGPTSVQISAHVYDGPCLAGANVEAKMLVKETLAQTEEVYFATTEDFGHFDIATSANLDETPYALIKITNAECHNEITNGVMGGKSYYGMIDLTSSVGRNIHPQTKGTIARTAELYTNPLSSTYQDFTASQVQSEQEWMAMFGITGVSARFGDMALDGASDGNAALLAMNIIHLQDNNEAKQIEFIQKLSDDIELDGVLDDADLIAEIKDNSMILNLSVVRANLVERYQILGLSITVPNFEDLIDSDGDGFLNGVDDNTPDAISFGPVTDSDLSVINESAVTISGITGTISVTGTAYHNGVLKTDFAAVNGDEIKLSLTSSANYATETTTSIQIGDSTYTYSVTTKADDRTPIMVFDSGQPAMDGDFGAANPQIWCDAQATILGLTGTIIPYLSTTTNLADQITEDPINPRPVKSISGGLVASKWSKFFDNEGTESFQALGITDADYWTGTLASSTNKGTLNAAYTCFGWTTNASYAIDPNAVGMFNSFDLANRTIEDPDRGCNTTYCNELKKILCISY